MKSTHIYITQDTKDALKKLAKQEGRTMAGMLHILIKNHKGEKNEQ